MNIQIRYEGVRNLLIHVHRQYIVPCVMLQVIFGYLVLASVVIDYALTFIYLQ